MLWRKKPALSLCRKILNMSDSSQHVELEYHPVTGGIDVKSLEEILTRQSKLLRLIEMTTETNDVFEERYWPAIERYAKMVHLLPASESYHHFEAGGMLRHGLEVGLYTMQYGKATLYGKDFGIMERAARERWLFACFITGLCHDLGKIEIDIKVVSETGLVWSPHSISLYEWAVNNHVKKYYVIWLPSKHQEHEQYSLGLLGKVFTNDDRDFSVELDSGVLKELMQALTGYSGSDSQLNFSHKLKKN